jgi:hypothetical protein
LISPVLFAPVGRGNTRHLVTTSGILATRANRERDDRPGRQDDGVQTASTQPRGGAGMGLFDALRGRRRASGVRRPDPKSGAYLAEWAAARRGVEAFVEPRTTVTETTVVLIAHDGEFTRRRISEDEVRGLGKRLGIPVYDVARVGYPQRMRDYTARKSAEDRRDGAG